MTLIGYTFEHARVELYEVTVNYRGVSIISNKTLVHQMLQVINCVDGVELIINNILDKLLHLM